MPHKVVLTQAKFSGRYPSHNEYLIYLLLFQHIYFLFNQCFHPTFLLEYSSLSYEWQLLTKESAQHTLYKADVEAEPTANATPTMESAWKLSAYAIMTMPVIAIIAATICQIGCKETEKQWCLWILDQPIQDFIKLLSNSLNLITFCTSLFKCRKAQY